jgi:hypothetical protein
MSKPRYMLEQPEYPTILVDNSVGSENSFGGANQQATKTEFVSGASEATRAARCETVMIWSAPLGDMGRQTEQETICPASKKCVLASNNMDLRSGSVYHVPDSEHDGGDADVGNVRYRSSNFIRPLSRVISTSELGCMLETPEYPTVLVDDSVGSENPFGAGNQQGSLRDPSEAICRALRFGEGDDMVRTPWRHGEAGGTRNDLPATQKLALR